MEITKVPSEILKQKIKQVSSKEIESGKYGHLISDMKKAMIENKGIGLAANQVGQDLALFVIDAQIAADQSVPEVYFNPEITDYSHEIDEMEEGCLSISKYYTQISRSKKIMLKFVDEKGIKSKIKARGFLARILQHETDHLNGLTIKDRVKK